MPDHSPAARLDGPPNVCYAKACGTGIAPNLLMCWQHWRRVPRRVQRVIWASNYVAHPEHESSRLAARASIAAKEGRDLTDAEREALAEYGLQLDGHPLVG